MADRRLQRFLHLERPRRPGTDRDGGDLPNPGGGRFEGVEQPRADGSVTAGALPPTGARLERFGPEPERPIALADAEGAPPFIRCARCGADSNSQAAECSACGVSLDTREQREFTDRFFAERGAEAAREARAEAERRELAARAEREEASARRAMAEALAREVGELERHRIEAEEGPFGLGSGRPLGLRLLSLLPGPRWQLAGALACAALVLGLIAHGLGGAHQRAGHSLTAGILLLVVLALPGGARWRRW